MSCCHMSILSGLVTILLSKADNLAAAKMRDAFGIYLSTDQRAISMLFSNATPSTAWSFGATGVLIIFAVAAVVAAVC